MPTKALRTAASGMYAQQKNIEMISNNIANVNTTSFKKTKAEFQDLMYQQVPLSTYSDDVTGTSQGSNDFIYVGNGVKISAASKLFIQGDLTETNNQFDLGIQGDGFFEIQKPDGTLAYSRDGSFKVNSQGKLVNSSGYGINPELYIDDQTASVSISKDGTVKTVDIAGNSTIVDEIQLVKFVNPAGLKPIGDNMYTESEYSGEPIYGTPGENGFGEVYQGYLESSNVDIVEEMISMISAQRSYEINSKTVKTVEEMMQVVNSLKR